MLRVERLAFGLKSLGCSASPKAVRLCREPSLRCKRRRRRSQERQSGLTIRASESCGAAGKRQGGSEQPFPERPRFPDRADLKERFSTPMRTSPTTCLRRSPRESIPLARECRIHKGARVWWGGRGTHTSVPVERWALRRDAFRIALRRNSAPISKCSTSN